MLLAIKLQFKLMGVESNCYPISVSEVIRLDLMFVWLVSKLQTCTEK